MAEAKGIMKIISSVGNTAAFRKPLKAMSKIGFVNKMESHAWNSDKAQSYITGLGILSLVLKDGFGCYLYVKQSLNNKKIPDDKRKFVAALDLTNGGLMIAMQLLAYATISHKLVQSKLFAKMFKKCIARPALKGYQALLEKDFANRNIKNPNGRVFHESADDYENSARKAFAHFSSLVAATIFGKRVVVPFIATPLADKAEKMMNKDKKEVTTDKGTENTYDKQTAPADKAQYRTAEVQQTNLLDKYQKQK